MIDIIFQNWSSVVGNEVIFLVFSWLVIVVFVSVIFDRFF